MASSKHAWLKIVVLLAAVLPPRSDASVLSSAGLGLPAAGPGARFMGMGGVSVALADGQSVSSINPASLHRIRLTQLAVQVVSDQIHFRDESGTSTSTYMNFNGFSFAVPLGRGLDLGLGLVPRTRMDYWVSFPDALDGESFFKTVQGMGGLNSAELTLACDIRSVVGIGLTGQYFFGKITETWRVLFDDAQFTGTNNQINTRSDGFGVTGGIIVHPSRALSLGGVFRPSARIGTSTEIFGSPLIAAPATRTGSLRLPAFWSAGVRYETPKGLSLGTEYSEEAWNDLTINGGAVARLQKRSRISAGAELMRGQLPTDGYFKRTAFRLGFYSERFYIEDSRGHSIREVMATLGFGFPLVTSASRVDVALGIGRRGSIKDNGLSESCIRVNISATIGEKWFERKY
jgi:hypothetical protein